MGNIHPIAPNIKLKIGLPVSGWFPKDTEAGRGLTALERMNAGGSLQPIRVVLHSTDGTRLLDADRLRGLKAVSNALASDGPAPMRRSSSVSPIST